MGIQFFPNHLFSILFFIVFNIAIAQENIFQSLTEFFFVKIQLDLAVHAYGNRSGFLAHHDRHRVRLLAQADRSPVAQTQGTIPDFTLAHREDTRGRHDPLTGENHSPIV